MKFIWSCHIMGRQCLQAQGGHSCNPSTSETEIVKHQLQRRKIEKKCVSLKKKF